MPAYWTSPTGTTFSLCVWEAGWTSPTLDHSPHHASVHRETSGQGWGVPWLWPWECKFCGCCQALPPLEYGDGVCTFPVRPFICTGRRWGSESQPRWDAQDSFSWGSPCPLQHIKETSWSLGSFYCNGTSFIVIWCEDSVKCKLHLVVLHIADNKFFCYHVSRIYVVVFHFLHELPKFTTIWSCASHFLDLNTGTQNLYSIGRPGQQPGLHQPANFSGFLIICSALCTSIQPQDEIWFAGKSPLPWKLGKAFLLENSEFACLFLLQ